MNTLEINDTLLNNKFLSSSFIGVFPCDYLTFKVNKYPCSLVVNTDPSYKEGEHWVCFYIDKNKTIEYFDSYGVPPLNDEILNFYKENGNGHVYNNKQLQGLSSRACGHYCVLYLISRGNNMNKDRIVNTLYSKHAGTNDQDVMSFVNKYLKVKNSFLQSGKGLICQCCKSCSDMCRIK